VSKDQEETEEILGIPDHLDQMDLTVKKAQREKLELGAKLVYQA